MAKISALLRATVLSGADILPMVQGNATLGASFAQMAAFITALLPQTLKGDPGGTDYAIGLFATAAFLTIPAGIDLVSVSGLDSVGDSYAGVTFVADPAVDAAFVAQSPHGRAFVDAQGRGFRLAGYKFNAEAARIRTIAAELDDLGLRSSQVLASDPDGVGDNTAELQAMIDEADCTILARPMPYVTSSSLILPAGRTVRVQPGARILYKGAGAQADGTPLGVFTLTDGTQLLCDGSDGTSFTVECPVDAPYVYAARVTSAAKFRLIGCDALRCHIIFITSRAGSYDDVVTAGMIAAGDPRAMNISSDAMIAGCSVTFDNRIQSHGSIYLGYLYDAVVRNCRGLRAHSLVQWWGGDAGPEVFQNGDPANERKCGRITVSDCTTREMQAASVFGSMGAEVIVQGCKSYGALDVAFDPEGSNDVVFRDCYSIDAVNGGFVTFARCNGVQFINCTSISTKKEYPVFRVWNSTQAPDNRGTTITGGRYECIDPTGAGSFDTALGCTRNLTISGAEIINCAVDLSANNNHEVVMRNCTLRLTRRMPSGFVWFATSGLHTGNYGPAKAVVFGNTFKSEVVQPADITVIRGYLDDFNASATMRIASNTFTLQADAGAGRLLLIGGATNPGVPQSYTVEDNELPCRIDRQTTGAIAAIYTVRRNADTSGNEILLTEVA